MRAEVLFFSLVAVFIGAILALGTLASITSRGSFVSLTFAFSLGSMLLGSAVLFGRNKPRAEYRNVYQTSGLAGSIALGRLEQSETPTRPKFNTPSGLPSRTRIEQGAGPWSRVFSFGGALILAGIIVIAALVFAAFI